MILRAPLLTETRTGKAGDAVASHLEGLVVNTTGTAGVMAAMNGVLTDTRMGTPHSSSRELLPAMIKTKTHAKSSGQVPYAGPKY